MIVKLTARKLITETEWNIGVADQFGFRSQTEYHWVDFEVSFAFDGESPIVHDVKMIADSVTTDRWGTYRDTPVTALRARDFRRSFLSEYETDADFAERWNQTILEEREHWQ